MASNPSEQRARRKDLIIECSVETDFSEPIGVKAIGLQRIATGLDSMREASAIVPAFRDQPIQAAQRK